MYDFLIDQQSAAALENLREDLEPEGGNLVAFTGAGLSRQGGLPLWTELLAEMAKEARINPPALAKAVLSSSDLLWQAEFFRNALGEEAKYKRFLRNRFTAQLEAGKEVFASLVKLNFRHFLTTNYDTFLEDALKNEKLPYDQFDWTDREECRHFFLQYLSRSAKRAVIHLHGRGDQPHTVVLSHSDYVNRYVVSFEYVDKLSVLFATLRLVFVGFSLEDPDLRYILRQVNVRFASGDVQNYAILGFSRDRVDEASVERQRLQKQFGITPIFYDDANHHKALGDVLSELRRDSATLATPPQPLADMWDSDPNKGKFGGRSEQGGRRLFVHDHEDKGGGKHLFYLTVEATAGAPPLTGTVTFFLHPTFPWPKVEVSAQNGKATTPVVAFGAFTVGAVCGDPAVRLELDLCEEDS